MGRIEFTAPRRVTTTGTFSSSSYVSQKRNGFYLEDVFAEGKIYGDNITQKDTSSALTIMAKRILGIDGVICTEFLSIAKSDQQTPN